METEYGQIHLDGQIHQAPNSAVAVDYAIDLLLSTTISTLVLDVTIK